MNCHALLATAVGRDGTCALVTVTSTEGSAPRDAGAWMIVTRHGFHGSIGGGTLEWRAMAEAQAMLEKNIMRRESNHLLGPDLGQCCGGRVTLVTQLVNAANLDQFMSRPAELRQVMLFGAGHVGRAVAMALAALPFDVCWIDNRANAFPDYVPANADARRADDPVQELRKARPGCLVLVMTHSHALDLTIIDAALRLSSIAHAGLIGSATKRARFVSRLKGAGVTDGQLSKLICPIGVGGISGKEPAVIAASAVAQLLVLDEALRRGDRLERHAQLSA